MQFSSKRYHLPHAVPACNPSLGRDPGGRAPAVPAGEGMLGKGDKGLMGAPAHGSGSRGTFGVWEQFRVDHIGADTRLGLA